MSPRTLFLEGSPGKRKIDVFGRAKTHHGGNRVNGHDTVEVIQRRFRLDYDESRLSEAFWVNTNAIEIRDDHFTYPVGVSRSTTRHHVVRAASTTAVDGLLRGDDKVIDGVPVEAGDLVLLMDEVGPRRDARLGVWEVSEGNVLELAREAARHPREAVVRVDAATLLSFVVGALVVGAFAPLVEHPGARCLSEEPHPAARGDDIRGGIERERGGSEAAEHA